jgi:nickel/cobalt exporter
MMRPTTSAIALTAALLASPALAHPHIFIDAKATVVFNDAGQVVAIRNAWTFDEAFSVWQTQGLDTNGDGITSTEEMQELADDNMVGLAEYGFYTFVGEGTETLQLKAQGEPRFDFADDRSTLSFSVAPDEPYSIRDGLELAINDPEYYVAITFAGPSDVTLENAPAGCAFHLDPPQTMSDDLAERLYALPPDITTLPPDLAAALRGVQGKIVVTCPAAAAADVAAAPATALDATAAVAEAAPTIPFGGPPPEPGLTLPKTGLFGWIADRQRDFYQAMTAALGALKQDSNAFWLLGTLSFLYGVFHAAGPGHGKVVISSYVLANERQVRRGIALSFAAAMLQSAVAIVFVLVAAAALNLTATAMGEVANGIGIVSYALVALLGLWLIGRKLFGWGHVHRPAGADVARTAHAHLHDHDHRHHHDEHSHDHGHDEHDHHHVVTPEQIGGGWREQLGVVLAVGLRPCSGALVVLAFALSQGVLLAGIIAVLLMGLGTAITVAILASLAVGIKGFALNLPGGGGAVAASVIWWAELLGAVLVFGFGALLLAASF